MALPATLPTTLQAEAALYLTHLHLSRREGLSPAQAVAAVERFTVALASVGQVVAPEGLPRAARATLTAFLGREVRGEARAFAA